MPRVAAGKAEDSSDYGGTNARHRPECLLQVPLLGDFLLNGGGAAAGYGSYIVGQAARYYFEHGASWGQQGPKRVVTRILENTDKQSVLERLKAEIKKKLLLNRYAGKS